MNEKNNSALVKVESVQTAMTRVLSNVLDRVAPSGQRLHHRFVMPAGTMGILSLAYLPDGKTIVSGSKNGTIEVWDITTGRCLHSLVEYEDALKPWGLKVIMSLTLLEHGEIVSVLRDGTVRVWDAHYRRCLHTFSSRGNASIACSRGGLLALVSPKRTMQVWDILNDRCLLDVGRDEGLICATALSSDQTRVVSGADDGTVKVWDIATNRCLHVLNGHSNPIKFIVCSPDGKSIVSGSNHAIKVWDVATGYCLHSPVENKEHVHHSPPVYSPEGKTIALARYGDEWVSTNRKNRITQIWSVSTGRCLHSFAGGHPIAYSPSGHIIALSDSNSPKTLKLRDLSTGEVLHELNGHTNRISRLTFSPDGKTVASSTSQDGTVRIWKVSTGRCLQVLNVPEGRVSNAKHPLNTKALASARSMDAKTIKLEQDGKSIKVWKTVSGCYLHSLNIHELPSHSGAGGLAYSPNGECIISWSKDFVEVRDASTGQCIHTLTGHSHSIYSASYSPDGKTIASSSYDHTIKIWDASTGLCLRTLEGHSNYVSSVTYSPDGKTVASTSSDETVRVWNVATGRCLYVLGGHRKTLASPLKYTSDGKLITIGPGGKTRWGGPRHDTLVRIWDATTGRCIVSLVEQEQRVGSFAYSPASKTLALVSHEGILTVWEASTGRCLHSFNVQPPKDTTISIAFSPDGKTIALGFRATIIAWDVSTGTCLKTLNIAGNWSVAYNPAPKGATHKHLLVAKGAQEVMFIDPQDCSILGTFYPDSGVWTTSPTPNAADGYIYAPDPSLIVVARIDNEGRLTPLSDDDPERSRYLAAHNRWDRVRAHIFGDGWTDPISTDRQLSTDLTAWPRLGPAPAAVTDDAVNTSSSQKEVEL